MTVSLKVPSPPIYSYWPLVIAKKMNHYEVIDTIKSLGIDAVELQIFDVAVPKDMTMGEYAKALCNYARGIGLEVPIFTVDSKIYCDDPENELAHLCSLVDVAAELNIPLMRFDIAYKFLGNESTKSPKKIIDTVVPYIRRLADYALGSIIIAPSTACSASIETGICLINELFESMRLLLWN